MRRFQKAHLIVSSVCLLGLGFMVLGVVFMRKPTERYAHSLSNWQDADASPGYPIALGGSDEDGPREYLAAEFDPNLGVLTGLERFRIPDTDFFQHPMGSAEGALVYDAQPFFEENAKRGGHHLGSDLNGIGGQQTDLGDPVRAIGNGLVLYAGTPSPGWGKTVLIAHRMPDGRLLQSMYAHLSEIAVTVGSLVGRGDRIGSVGTAGGRYLAHLHFEIREGSGLDVTPEKTVGLTLNGGYANRKFNRLDPAEELRRYPVPADAGPAVLGILRREERSLQNLEIEAGGTDLGEILGQ